MNHDNTTIAAELLKLDEKTENPLREIVQG